MKLLSEEMCIVAIFVWRTGLNERQGDTLQRMRSYLYMCTT
jgi:hypothetical protein